MMMSSELENQLKQYNQNRKIGSINIRSRNAFNVCTVYGTLLYKRFIHGNLLVSDNELV